MTSRRKVITGFLAAGLTAPLAWADVGNPSFLSAAKTVDGGFALFGLDANGRTVFSLPLPARGHAGAAHPFLAQAVAFARRPGNFALVIDCATGVQIGSLKTPEGRHFYGHGTYSPDGTLLFTTENNYEIGQGVIGVWDQVKGYKRIAEFASYGIGPHEILTLSGSGTLVIANGGIETHPDSGRAKLNLATMRPNLSYVSHSGELLDQVELDPELHRNSIRHLAVNRDGLVAFGTQWQGETSELVPLLGCHRRGNQPEMIKQPDQILAGQKGYVGSLAFSSDGKEIATTSPRGGEIHVFGTQSWAFTHKHRAMDVCGIGAHTKSNTTGKERGFIATTGTGNILKLADQVMTLSCRHQAHWDNHLIALV